MKSSKATPWVAGTVVVALLILVAAWMLAISPQLRLAETARADAEDAKTQNTVHAQRLAMLEVQFEDLDTYKAELAALRLQTPAEDGEPALIREIDAAAGASSVFVLSVVSAPAVPFVGTPVAVEAEAPVVDVGAVQDEASGEAAVVEPQPTAPATLEGFYVIPVEITVLGTYPNTVAFVTRMQEQIQRLFLLTEFTITGQKEADATGGRPATAEGDAEFLVRGYVYVLRDTTPDVPDETTAEGSTEDVATEDGTATVDN